MSDDFWTVADLHLGHPHVSRLRGFETTQAHDATIMKNLNIVPDGTTLICLGDISVRQDR